MTARRLRTLLSLILAGLAGLVSPACGATPLPLRSGALRIDRHAIPTGNSATAAGLTRSLGRFVVPTSASGTGFGPFKESPFVGDTAQRLRRVFGSPTSTKPNPDSSCIIRWRGLGITATVAAYGTPPIDPCREGSFVSAQLTGARWQTPRGIHPGSSQTAAARHALRTCTRKTCGIDGYVLGLHPSDCAAALVPSVIAQVAGGRVIALVVESHSCE